ncbi:nucleotidyltransferase [bacterium E08(2017)]|nr:nucleotidyltransferase [bacterium E08(2017)]
MKPDLLIMAAGMGSRYGGLKQIDSLGPSGETIIDYSVYDAIRAGFGRVIFIIRRSIEQEFKAAVGNKYEGKIEVLYAFQEIDILPEGFSVPEDREKPWGTGHAILMAKDIIDRPFAVINSDDFYGSDSLKTIAEFLSVPPAENQYCMVGYKLSNTLSSHGTVSRGICETDKNGLLKTITETHRISPPPITSDAGPLTGDEIVSMNMWGFTPSFFKHLEEQFSEFMKSNADDPKAEFYIPFVITLLIESGEATVNVLHSSASWLGVTYKEDKPGIMDELKAMTDNGTYPTPLFG